MPADDAPARKGSRNFLRYNRYILVIDGQRKSSYVDAASAQAEADKIQAAYPRLNVVIHDQEQMLGGATPDATDAQDAHDTPGMPG